MDCLLIASGASDLSAVLESCGAKITRMTAKEALYADLTPYDCYGIFADGEVLDARLRVRLEEENAKGKRVFTEALNSWGGIYSAPPADTTTEPSGML